MLNKIKILKKDELVKGSFILFIMLNLFNFLNYIYHFFMARMLTTSDYGILMSLFSLIYIFSVPGEAIQTIFSKYTTHHSKNKGEIKDLLLRGLRKAIKIAFLLYLAFIPVAIFLSFFLDIKFTLFALTGLFIFGSFVSPVVRGVLQGKKRFVGLGISLDLESVSKIIIAIILVLAIGNVYGAVYGVILSTIFGFLTALYFIRDILEKKRKKVAVKGIYGYSWNAFLLFTIVMLMLSLDVILAKRFFSPDMAGKYAVASLLGKTIFFATSGIGKAMFPISSEKKVREKRKVLKKALVLTVSLSLIAIFAFLIVPELVISILFGSKYIEIGSILVYMGIAFSFLSITNLIILHKLSYKSVKYPYFMVVFVLMQVLLLYSFGKNVLEFSIALCFANFLALLGSLFLKSKK